MEAMTEERLDEIEERERGKSFLHPGVIRDPRSEPLPNMETLALVAEVRRLRAEVERVKALESAARGLLGARDGLVKARLDDVGPLGVHEALEVVMAAERSLRALLAARV